MYSGKGNEKSLAASFADGVPDVCVSSGGGGGADGGGGVGDLVTSGDLLTGGFSAAFDFFVGGAWVSCSGVVVGPVLAFAVASLFFDSVGYVRDYMQQIYD